MCRDISMSEFYRPLNEDFMYADHSGTYLNNNKINLNKRINIENATGSISTKYWDEKKNEQLNSIKNKDFPFDKKEYSNKTFDTLKIYLDEILV